MTDHAKLLEDLKWSLSIRRDGELRLIRLEHQIDPATSSDVDEIVAAAWMAVDRLAAAVLASPVPNLAGVSWTDVAPILDHVIEGRREKLMPLTMEKTIDLIAEGVLAVVLARLSKEPIR